MTISAFRTQCASYSTHPGIARWEFSNAQIYSIIHNSLLSVSDRIADDVRLHEERSSARSRSHTRLRDTRTRRTHRGVAESQAQVERFRSLGSINPGRCQKQYFMIVL